MTGVAGGQPALACFQGRPGPDGRLVFELGALNVLGLRSGRVQWIAGFLDPVLLAQVSVEFPS